MSGFNLDYCIVSPAPGQCTWSRLPWLDFHIATEKEKLKSRDDAGTGLQRQLRCFLGVQIPMAEPSAAVLTPAAVLLLRTHCRAWSTKVCTELVQGSPPRTAMTMSMNSS